MHHGLVGLCGESLRLTGRDQRSRLQLALREFGEATIENAARLVVMVIFCLLYFASSEMGLFGRLQKFSPHFLLTFLRTLKFLRLHENRTIPICLRALRNSSNLLRKTFLFSLGNSGRTDGISVFPPPRRTLI